MGKLLIIDETADNVDFIMQNWVSLGVKALGTENIIF